MAPLGMREAGRPKLIISTEAVLVHDSELDGVTCFVLSDLDLALVVPLRIASASLHRGREDLLPALHLDSDIWIRRACKHVPTRQIRCSHHGQLERSLVPHFRHDCTKEVSTGPAIQTP